MSLQKLLTEIATDIIFHFTRYNNLMEILRDNKFNTSNVLGTATDEHHSRGKFYFLSFQRSGFGNLGYARFIRYVRIEIDGRLLNQNYKFIPVDYWNAPRDPVAFPDNRDQMLRNNEMEDRLVTNENEIPNASKYIRRIDILVTDSDIKHEKYHNLLIKINEYANKLNLDIFYYTDRVDWDNRTDNTVKFEELGLEETQEEQREDRSPIDWDVVVIIKLIDEGIFNRFKDEYLNNKTFISNFEKYYSKDGDYDSPEDYFNDRMKEAESDYSRYNYGVTELDDWRLKEKKSVIGSFFHNYRSDRYESARALIKAFVDMMNKHNLKNLSEVIIKANKQLS